MSTGLYRAITDSLIEATHASKIGASFSTASLASTGGHRMPETFHVDDSVYVPSSQLGAGVQIDQAFYRTTVVARQGRSVQVSIPGGAVSGWIATSRLHKTLGVAIVTIGDFQTEETLLNPLSKSVLQFCRLLLDDSSVVSLRIRAISELGEWWKTNHLAYSHIVMIGHGSKDGIFFGVGGLRKAVSFERRVAIHKGPKRVFISLCCETGRAPFAKDFSALKICSNLMAPFHSVHGAVASQFCQTFLTWHILQGKSVKVAYKKAAASVPGNDSYKLWRAGSLIRGGGS
jgi:hypothetical protein